MFPIEFVLRSDKNKTKQNKKKSKQTNKETKKQLNKQKPQQTNNQTNKQASKQTNKIKQNETPKGGTAPSAPRIIYASYSKLLKVLKISTKITVGHAVLKLLIETTFCLF